MLVLFFAALFSTANAQSPVPTLEGQYKIETHVQSHKRILRELVASYTKAGAQRLLELRAQGFGCKLLADQRHQCSKIEDATFPVALGERVLAREQKLGDVLIGAETAPVVLIHESDFYTEWLVQRPLEFAGVKCPSFHFMKSNVFEKVRATETCGKFEFIFDRAQGALATQVYATQIESPFEAEYIGYVSRTPAR
jgi:hypothetical protein